MAGSSLPTKEHLKTLFSKKVLCVHNKIALSRLNSFFIFITSHLCFGPLWYLHFFSLSLQFFPSHWDDSIALSGLGAYCKSCCHPKMNFNIFWQCYKILRTLIPKNNRWILKRIEEVFWSWENLIFWLDTLTLASFTMNINCEFHVTVHDIA